MTIRNKPDYGIYTFNLTVAGQQDFPIIGSRIAMISAVLSGANVGAIVNVQIGKALGDPIPFTVGSSCHVDNKFDYVRFSWAAQNGVTAIFIVSDDVDGNGVNAVAPPTVTTGSVSITQGGNTALVNASGELTVQLASGAQPAQVGADGALDVRIVGGPVSAINAAAVTNPALNGLQQSAATGTPQVQPNNSGGSTFASITVAASGSTTIKAPAANVNGIVVRTAWIGGLNADQVGLFAGGNPASFIANGAILINYGSAGAVGLIREIFLPAGVGLYLYNNSASATSAWLTYDVL